MGKGLPTTKACRTSLQARSQLASSARKPMERLKDVVLHGDQTPTAIWLLLLEHVRDRFE